MNNDLLFVYGSLLDIYNEFGQYVMQNASFVSKAAFKGRLFDCGEYPGAIADSKGYNIIGSIYRLNNVTTALAVLDDYEGFGIEQEQPNLFTRNLMVIQDDGIPLACWVYLYNLPVEGLTEITSGDYAAYRQA